MTRIFLFFLILSIFISQQAFADCSDPPGKEAEMEFFTDTNEYKFCNGAEWVLAGGGEGGGGGVQTFNARVLLVGGGGAGGSIRLTYHA